MSFLLCCFVSKSKYKYNFWYLYFYLRYDIIISQISLYADTNLFTHYEEKMKKSFTNEGLAQENAIDMAEQHYIYDLIDTLNSFFRNHFDGAVKVESLIEHPFYIAFEGDKFSKFLNYALSLEMGGRVIHIYLREMNDELNVLIGTSEDLKITAENESELRRLADDIGFSISLNDKSIIASKSVKITNTIPLHAINIQKTLYDQLYLAFFGSK